MLRNGFVCTICLQMSCKLLNVSVGTEKSAFNIILFKVLNT